MHGPLGRSGRSPEVIRRRHRKTRVVADTYGEAHAFVLDRWIEEEDKACAISGHTAEPGPVRILPLVTCDFDGTKTNERNTQVGAQLTHIRMCVIHVF